MVGEGKDTPADGVPQGRGGARSTFATQARHGRFSKTRFGQNKPKLFRVSVFSIPFHRKLFRDAVGRKIDWVCFAKFGFVLSFFGGWTPLVWACGGWN
jgi:hypothetical protein